MFRPCVVCVVWVYQHAEGEGHHSQIASCDGLCPISEELAQATHSPLGQVASGHRVSVVVGVVGCGCRAYALIVDVEQALADLVGQFGVHVRAKIREVDNRRVLEPIDGELRQVDDQQRKQERAQPLACRQPVLILPGQVPPVATQPMSSLAQ